MPYCKFATLMWVNTGSGNGLLPDGIKPLPEPMLTYHQSSKMLCVIHLRAVSQEKLLNLIRSMSSDNTLLNLLPHIPGTNEFIGYLVAPLATMCSPSSTGAWGTRSRSKSPSVITSPLSVTGRTSFWMKGCSICNKQQQKSYQKVTNYPFRN